MSPAGPEPAEMLSRFLPQPVSITSHPGGHINRSWRVDGPRGPFLLQRLNPDIFADGAGVMRNVDLVSQHLMARLLVRYPADAHRRGLRLHPARDGARAVQADDGAWWRLLTFIEGAVVRERVTTVPQAFEAGRAFGEFLTLLADFDGATLGETIPGFRDTGHRVRQLDAAVAADAVNRVREIRGELAALDLRRDHADWFPSAIASGALPRRVVHNDAKSGNVLRDASSGAALAVIDLDTVMPGTALSDMGDLIRSMASPTDEDEPRLDRIVVESSLVEGLARGYLAEAGGTLSAEERRQFVAAGIVTTYQQAVRFFTDYLDGDRYYRTSRAGQNLDRGRAQLALLISLEANRGPLEKMVAGL